MSARHKQFGTEGPSIDELLQSDHAEVAESAERRAEIVIAVRMSVLGVEAQFCL